MAAQNHAISISEVQSDENLGEKVNLFIKLQNSGFLIPNSFVIKSQAYFDFLKENDLEKKVKHLLGTVDLNKAKSILETASYINRHIAQSDIPNHILKEILKEYKKLSGILNHAHVQVSFSHVSNLPSHEIKGDAALLTKIKENWISIYQPKSPKVNPTLVVQKMLKGKIGKIRTSTKQIKTLNPLSKIETESLENLVVKFKKEFYMPHEIDWTIDNGKTYIIKIKPETHIDSHKTFFSETNYTIVRNSHHAI